jgi:hypothetical protein
VKLVMRLIRQANWDSPARLGWLPDGDIPASPLLDFANTTEDHCLSVWLIDENRSNLGDVVAAFAATRDKPDKLDYVLFREDLLAEANIETCATLGGTPDENVNQFHRDLKNVSGKKALALTLSTWHENLEVKRIDAGTVVQRIADSVRHGGVPLDKLKPKLRDAVRTFLGDMPGKPR